jgi:hypothetical protein
VGVGRFLGTLADKNPSLGGACGRGGPDAFFRVVVPLRADVGMEAVGVGFTPRIGVLSGGCIDDWQTNGLLCTRGMSGWITDLAPGTELVVAIGTDPDDPALDAEPSPGEPDPLAFAIDVAMRSVLEAGELCMPSSRGRCVTGTACLRRGEGSGLDTTANGSATVATTTTSGTNGANTTTTVDAGSTGGPWRCTTLEADTCANAEIVSVGTDGATVVIDPARPQTDAHHHSCMGARSPERVFRLELSPDIRPETALRLALDDPDAALAVRLPGCSAADEIACGEAGVQVTIDDAQGIAAAGLVPHVFVELGTAPDSADDTDDGRVPFALVVEVVGG